MQMRLNRSRWLVPGFAVAMGLLIFGIQWANDDPRGGLVSLAIMAGFAVALVAFSGRASPTSWR